MRAIGYFKRMETKYLKKPSRSNRLPIECLYVLDAFADAPLKFDLGRVP